MMTRKQFLNQIGIMGGTSLLAPTLLLQSCKYEPKVRLELSELDIPFLEEVAHTIFPGTDEIPSRESSDIGSYLLLTYRDCMEPEEQAVFLSGINTLDKHCGEEFNQVFTQLSSLEKLSIVADLQEEAIAFGENQKDATKKIPHWFDLMKNITLTGYFTSKAGMTKVREYNPVPGRYEGCTPYKEGQKIWS